MGFKDFEAISDYCEEIESLTHSQIELILDQDYHLYYKKRCQEAKEENPEETTPIKIEIQETKKYKTPEKGSETEEEAESPTKNFN